MKHFNFKKKGPYFVFSRKDTLKSLIVLLLATAICHVVLKFDDSIIIFAMIYVLSVAIISRITTGYFYGIFSCFIAVFCDNYMFTYPYFDLNFSLSSYPVSFLGMLTVSIIICTMTTQLKEKEALAIEAQTEKMRSNLLLSVSHDLRTPLTSIIGAISAILENYDMLTKERRVQLLTDVKDDAEWLIRMVENLLYITRVKNGGSKLNKSPEISEEIISEAVTKLKKRYPNAPVHIKIPEDVFLVPMDPMLIEQVIMNLLENAIRHGEHVTSILLTLSKDEHNAIFEVKDNGVGIAPSVLPHLFDGKILTSESDKMDSTKNMGIGLSVCSSIISAHNGTLEAHNNIDGGATFTFRLPLKEELDE